MDKMKLEEIRNRIEAIPVLEENQKRLKQRIYDAESRVRELLDKYQKESRDVERLKNESLSATLFKLIGQYEKKLEKEIQEELLAKIEYDKAVDRVNELKREWDELNYRICQLKKDKDEYEFELRKREKTILNNVNCDAFLKYGQLERERTELCRQLVETDEAISVANRVMNTINITMHHLEKAKSWATYDVWTNKRFFSHMAKYEHIDNAQQCFSRLSYQLRDLSEELKDVGLYNSFETSEISSATRVLDFWFDNIFTDLNVRNKIVNDIKQLGRLKGNITKLISKLGNDKNIINNKIIDIEKKKEDILIALG